MSHPIVHIQEALFAVALSAMSAIAYMLMAVAAQTEADAVRWSMGPLLGALIGSGICYLLNRDREESRIIAGRTIFALFGGVGIPKFASLVHPAVSEFLTDPLIPVLLGVVFGMVSYFYARPAVERLAARSPNAANDMIDGALKIAGDQLKSIGLTAPVNKWNPPPVVGDPNYPEYQAYLEAENARMAALAKQSTPTIP